MIKLEKLNYSYKNDLVLKDIDFTAKKGELVCIVGANGSGKSTLIYILCKILKADRYLSIKLSDKISYVPQENGLFENMTVRDNFDFWASAFKTEVKYSNFSKEDLKKKVKELSGGMKKRLSISIALLKNYDYIILDEPSASLDLLYQEEVKNTMIDIKNSSKGVIFSSHNLNEISISDYIYVIHCGEIVYSDKTEHLLKNDDFYDNLLNLIQGVNNEKQFKKNIN